MRVSYNFFLCFTFCCLSLILMSCGDTSTSGTTTVTSNATSASSQNLATQHIKATPRSSASARSTSTVAPSPTSPSSVAFSKYQGDGYTLQIPTLWKKVVSDGGMSLSDPQDNNNSFAVQSMDQQGISADSALSSALAGIKGTLENSQGVESAPTDQVDGADWNQAALTGESKNPQTGQMVNVKMVLLMTLHRADGRVYGIYRAATQVSFDTTEKNYFQPMLQSFKFIQ